jgi:hypothetical protein
MQPQPKPDRLNMRVWLILVIVGAALSLIAWYRYFQ